MVDMKELARIRAEWMVARVNRTCGHERTEAERDGADLTGMTGCLDCGSVWLRA